MDFLRINPRLHVWLFMAALAALLIQPASSALRFGSISAQPSAEALAALSQHCSQPVDKAWIQRVRRIRWVTYSSPTRSLTGNLTLEAINRDLSALRRAGFTGLITYGSSGLMGRQFLAAAQNYDFKGVIVGIWDPASQAELNNAIRAADMPIVLGFSVGNEGLFWPDERYTIPTLCSAISGIRGLTGKPVTTSEAIHVYYGHPEILLAGDWIFPNAHPYWHGVKYADEAVPWQQDQYFALTERTNRFIFFKEVGLPTSGAPGLNERNQDQYYRELAKTPVQFAYFEGFDQPSKNQNSVEPHWGIFQADLAPKLLAWNLMGFRAFTSNPDSNQQVIQCSDSQRPACRPKMGMDALLAGRDLDGHSYQSVLAFDTGGLPDNATIISIKLKIRIGEITGINPLKGVRNILVDICRANTAVVPEKEYCVSNAGRLSAVPKGGWIQVSLDPAAFQAINTMGKTQLRLRPNPCAPQSDRRGYVSFESGQDDPGVRPVLVVKYRLP